MATVAYDAVILAGGQARRLGGIDKPGLIVAGRSLLDAVLAACAGAEHVVVVGPERTTARPVLWAREEPPGGGPLAALAAGLSRVTADVLVLLAADLPFLDAGTVERLVNGLLHDGAMIVDEDGRDQILCSVWRADAVRRVLPADPNGASLRSALGHLAVDRLQIPSTPGGLTPWTDCDTPADLARARGTT